MDEQWIEFLIKSLPRVLVILKREKLTNNFNLEV